MPYFKWLGRGKAWVDARVQRMQEQIVFPEKRGKPKVYEVAKKDGPLVVEQKRKAQAEYRAMREKELRKKLNVQDMEGVLGPDEMPGQLHCRKGERVYVDPKHPGMVRLLTLADEDGVGGWESDGNWEVVEGPKGKMIAKAIDPAKEPKPPKPQKLESDVEPDAPKGDDKGDKKDDKGKVK